MRHSNFVLVHYPLDFLSFLFSQILSFASLAAPLFTVPICCAHHSAMWDDAKAPVADLYRSALFFGQFHTCAFQQITLLSRKHKILTESEAKQPHKIENKPNKNLCFTSQNCHPVKFDLPLMFFFNHFSRHLLMLPFKIKVFNSSLMKSC